MQAWVQLEIRPLIGCGGHVSQSSAVQLQACTKQQRSYKQSSAAQWDNFPKKSPCFVRLFLKKHENNVLVDQQHNHFGPTRQECRRNTEI
jgi:hypothetical protein